MDESALSRDLGGIPVRLLNDLEALAQAIPFLPAAGRGNDPCRRAAAPGHVGGDRAGNRFGRVIPGLGGGGYRALASEGSHADFAPNDELQAELLAYLRPRFGHVSWERVGSGSGIPNIYAFLKDSGRWPEPPWLAAQLAAASDPVPLIIGSGMENTSAICKAALDLFVAILAAEAGNLALKVLALGGVYFGGGIPPRVLPLLRAPAFRDAFIAKGRFSELLARIPLRVITNPEAGLWGAARFGMECHLMFS